MEFLQALEPWMIPIVIMICVTLIVAISVIGSIITTSMKKKNNNLSDNQEFLDALRDFKESMEKRVINLEKIAAAENSLPKKRAEYQGKQKKPNAIELELDENRSKEEVSNQSSNLKNMLNQ